MYVDQRPHECVFTRLTGVLIFLNIGSSGGLLDSICYLSGQLHRCFGFVIVGLTGALKSFLQSLWTTAPATELDFVGSSGVC